MKPKSNNIYISMRINKSTVNCISGCALQKKTKIQELLVELDEEQLEGVTSQFPTAGSVTSPTPNGAPTTQTGIVTIRRITEALVNF